MDKFQWLKSYPHGVRWDADISTMPIPHLLDAAAAKWPDCFAIDFMGRRTTYRELLDLANRAARGFQQIGVRPGVHVGLYHSVLEQVRKVVVQIREQHSHNLDIIQRGQELALRAVSHGASLHNS